MPKHRRLQKPARRLISILGRRVAKADLEYLIELGRAYGKPFTRDAQLCQRFLGYLRIPFQKHWYIEFRRSFASLLTHARHVSHLAEQTGIVQLDLKILRPPPPPDATAWERIESAARVRKGTFLSAKMVRELHRVRPLPQSPRR